MKVRKTSSGWILVCWFVTAILPCNAQPSSPKYGQIRVPVFRTKADSVQLLSVQKKIDDELARKKFSQRKVDSLMQLQNEIYQQSITYKMIYRPNRDYVLTDSLTGLSDFSGITKVCVYHKKEVPEIVWKCKDLEALELVNTQVTVLPKELNTLPLLKTIHIYRNHSKKPLRLFKNETVTSLTILNESPIGLPRSFKKYKALTKLDLAENGLTKFPNGARRNKKLAELGLQRNALTLRGKIKPHPYLERLALHGNLIEVVPSSIRKFNPHCSYPDRSSCV